MEETSYATIYAIKTFFVCLFIFYTDYKLLGMKKVNKSQSIFLILTASIIALAYKYISNGSTMEINNFILILLGCSIISLYVFKVNFIYSILVNIIALAINQILLFLATMISYFPSRILNIYNDYVSMTIILTIQWLLVILLWKIKRINKGIVFIKTYKDNEFLNLILIYISISILFLIILVSNYKQKITSKFGVVLIIFSIIMFITIQKSLQLYYKHKMLVKALEETQRELKDKKEEVKKLEEENLNFSETSHSISHRQKSIEHKLNILLANNGNINSKDIENEIKNIRKELEIETKVKLKKTGIAVIDDMLSYMQAECIKNNINFQLQISGNMYHMVNNYIDKSDLEILLADHIKDAIIAVNHVETNNKSILVRIGEIDGKYGVYFYDSGVEFTIGTLIKLGKVPVTTYKEEGGSGMGFMNSFNTLNKYKATLIIEELNKPTNDNFTKVLKFIFNEEEKFKILSYRNQEIANKNNNKELIIEKLQK